MPGPGGGSRGGGGHGGGGFGGGGGGFRGGGGFGGGPRGGGFHGGPHRPPMHHHHYWGWGFGPRRYYGGFGGGGCLGILMLPIILILVAVMILVATLGGACSAIAQGGVTQYNEKSFQDYADEQYQVAFGSSSAYEDNILLVVLTTEEANEYYWIAWVGDHVATNVNYLFGAEGTALGNAMASSINTSGYWHSLDSNLAGAVDIMTNRVTALGNASNFTCQENHVQAASKVYNYSDFTITDSTVNTALENFTTQTGISISVVVEDSTDVLKTNYSSMIVGLIVVAAFVGVAIFLIVKITKKNKNNGQNNQSNQNNDYANGNFTV